MSMSIESIIKDLEALADGCDVEMSDPRRQSSILRAAIEKLETHQDNQPSKTADPVHVAGGCYCRECLRGKKASAEKIACPLSTVYRLPTDFCSDGKSKQIDFEAKEGTP